MAVIVGLGAVQLYRDYYVYYHHHEWQSQSQTMRQQPTRICIINVNIPEDISFVSILLLLYLLRRHYDSPTTGIKTIIVIGDRNHIRQGGS
jgi:hypothetical protein